MREAEKPKIIKRGNDPNCVHYEKISGGVGTCQRCGQVRSYNSNSIGYWGVRTTPEPKKDGESLLPS
jgi:hypothetical protein